MTLKDETPNSTRTNGSMKNEISPRTALLNGDEANKSFIPKDKWTNGWTKKDWLLLALTAMVKFGDGVEIYLPGVITQLVSCELGVSSFEEGILGLALYAAMMVSIFCAAPITTRLGVRPVVLTSLYTSIIFTVLCALVPSYYTLVISRVLIGISLGLNLCPVVVYTTELASCYRVQKTGSYLGTLCFCIGGTWVSFLGYLLLDRVGWRVFVLLTSAPVFVPPIFLLHCCLTENGSTSSTKSDNEEEVIEVSNFARRVTNVGILSLVSNLQGVGSILLVPSVIRAFNSKANDGMGDPCGNVVQGSQFLILTAVTGGPNILGRVISILFHGKYRFSNIQSVISVFLVIIYGCLMIPSSLTTMVLVMGLAKLFFSVQMSELSIIWFDVQYFGTAGIKTASGIASGLGYVGCVTGIALAAFLDPDTAIVVTFVISLLQIGVACTALDLKL